MVNKPTVACVIYTRKSSDEGLDQAFNSLDAQYESCEAYIESQKHEGWKLSRSRYDDGGISGATLFRPSLERLLSDMDKGLVKMIVVYKIDRLTRSLADFARLVERMDAAGCSFVSVTQAFNTSNSMGRLTLNVLLSFAQFEREVTAERIRDKIAASKAKGMWMGGYSKHQHRRTEIEKIIVKRHGAQVPETDDASIYMEAIAYSMNAAFQAAGMTDLFHLKHELQKWCENLAPWAIQSTVIDEVIDCVAGKKHDLSNRDIASLLNVFWDERQAYGLKTIAACDKTKAEFDALRKELKRENDKERKRQKRKAQGRISRKTYEADSLSKSEPWNELGISRRTYYRRKAAGETQEQADGTGVSRIGIYKLLATDLCQSTSEASDGSPVAKRLVLRSPSTPSQELPKRLSGNEKSGS